MLAKINFEITSVPADGTSAAGGKLRHVPVSWAALWQAAACQYLSICGTEIKAQGRVENSIRVGSAGRSYFEPKCYESISQSAGRSSCRPRKVMWE